ncbi:flavodoxin family protein [uncultured Clostridium sp.]|uniref:flavodoxin family protein n=1 Tax=uncultured Clostridium sp. TaxID=59620 RepID=UPI0025E3E92D|nr:flavodoxin family protein [uncultured Clostridium sp.]
MLLIHDLSKNIETQLIPYLRSDTKIFSQEISNIHPCLGCFKCWIKTPGRCVIKDDYTELPKYILQNNTYVCISAIKYGCYSPYIKNIIDRSIGFLLPFFRFVKGDIHHSLRYKNIPRLVFIAYGNDITEDEKQTFYDLAYANSINYEADKFEVLFAENIKDLQNILADLKED